MLTATPGQTLVVTEDGIPSDAVVGFQVLKAASGMVALGRSTNGVVERPTNSGNYVITFVAPAENDLFLIVIDWSDGVLAPETTMVKELQITSSTVAAPSELGSIADHAKLSMGGEIWNGLLNSPNYGSSEIALAVATIKSRIFTVDIPTASESTLPELVLDYLGKLTALQLVPAARDFWANAYISITRGDDSSEVVTYPNRATLIDDLRDDLLRAVRALEPLVIPIIDNPRMIASTNGPAIDEDENSFYVTADPRTFPPAETFPYNPLYFPYGLAELRRRRQELVG